MIIRTVTYRFPDTEITVNFRILPGDHVSDVMEHVRKLCQGYDIELIADREPSAISSENVRGFEIIKENIAQLYPEAIVSSYITIGGNDAYKYQIVSDHIYRILLIELNLTNNVQFIMKTNIFHLQFQKDALVF